MFTEGDDAELELLEKLMKKVKARKSKEDSQDSVHTGPQFNIGTFNAISPVGLKKFPPRYKIMPLASGPQEAHAILLRSHKLKNEEVPDSVRAIARCGAGTNNIPVDTMTDRGIPVFNTPGANANAVKELVICALLLASRGIVEGAVHMDKMWATTPDVAKLKKQVEADKKLFVGQELKGKTLGVVGLGHIGTEVAVAALALGMKVAGYDPAISLQAAWNLPGDRITRCDSVKDLLEISDYVTLHVPYIPNVTHHLINDVALSQMKKSAHLINFARGELVDSVALSKRYEAKTFHGKYVADFPDEALHGNPKVILIPHLGASTEEAEENSAAMAADTIRNFVEDGQIRHSVNFPSTPVDMKKIDNAGAAARLCIVNRNVPGVLGRITSTLGDLKLNIASTINASRGDIAYNVVDLTKMPEDPVVVQRRLANLDGVISSRLLEPSYQVGNFYVTGKGPAPGKDAADPERWKDVKRG